MYLSVQLAARRMGVSPHTIRRWTASGFLPCTRTAGGHRRIKQEDIDELASAIGGSNHLAAGLARERELETLVQTSVALASRLDLPELLAEIARQMTSLLNCHNCAIHDYDEASKSVRVLAEFDYSGKRQPEWGPYSVNEFPLTRKVITEQEPAVVNINDPAADPAETAIMRRYGDKCMLLLPLVYRGRTVGFLEVLDHARERRFTRQEMRLARALAGQAAVALHNATIFAQLHRSDRDVRRLRKALGEIGDSLGDLFAHGDVPAILQVCATYACRTVDAISSVASCGEHTAGAACARTGGDKRATGANSQQRDAAHVVVSTAPCATGDDLTLTVTLAQEAGEGYAELLRLLAVAAALAIAQAAPASD